MKSHAGAVHLAMLSSALLGCGRMESPRRWKSAAFIDSIPGIVETFPTVFGGQRIWALEREPGLSASLVDPMDSHPGMRLNPHARTRLFILKGRLRLRVGVEERELGAGSFVSIPRGMLDRLLRVGTGETLYLRLLAPDIDKDVILEPRRRGGKS